MPRVLRLITRLNRGGPLRQLGALVPGLAARGWDGPVLAGITERDEPDGSDDLLAQGADVHPLPDLRRGLDPRADTRALRSIVGWIRRVRPDVLHTHTGKAGALGRAAARLTGVRVVHTLHGHHLDEEGLLGYGTRAAERVLGRLGDALVCLSASQRADVVERHRILPDARVCVIEPGLDVEAFRRAAGSPSARAPDAPFHVLWTGRFVDVKRPLALLDVVAAVRAPVRLTALGEGPLRAAFLEAAAARGLGDRVQAPGVRENVAPDVAAADALVLTSRSEGVPLAVLEAMVLGTPVVVPAVGGLVDVIRDRETGRILPADDDEALAGALDELAADPAGAGALGARARREARRRFAGGRLADETSTLYERLCGRASPPSAGR